MKGIKELRGVRVIARHVKKYREALKIFYDREIPVSAVAGIIGINKRTVCNWLQVKKKLNLPCHLYNIRKYHQAIELKRWEGGILSGSQIARIIGAKPKTVRLWLKKEGLC